MAYTHLRDGMVLRARLAYLHNSGRSMPIHCWHGWPPPHRVFLRRHSRQAVVVEMRGCSVPSFACVRTRGDVTVNVWYIWAQEREGVRRYRPENQRRE
jgi:hypothetical protein